jgi:C4-dicarboxylate transporter DctM subunit
LNGAVLAGLVVALALLRQPVVLIVAAAIAFVHAFMTRSSIEFLIQDMWNTVDREVLLSIPLFVLAGLIMARGSIAGRLTRFMVALTSPIPGGLAVGTILALTVFGAVSGTSAVTMMAIGAIMYPALLANGYSKSFSLGLLASGGTLGVIIPPSLLMIVYGVMTEVSITDLFTAGWGPGLLLSGLLAIYSIALHWRMATQPFDPAEIVASFKDGILALLMPIILLGGIYSGLYTVTESAAIAVVYAVAVEVLVYRELGWRQAGDIVVENLKMLGALMPLLAMAVSLNNIL